MAAKSPAASERRDKRKPTKVRYTLYEPYPQLRHNAKMAKSVGVKWGNLYGRDNVSRCST